MTHILTLKAGLETRYSDIQYTRQGFVAYNKNAKQQEGLPFDAFDITPLEKILPEIFVAIEQKVVEQVKLATKDAASQIVELATKTMEEKLKDAGNVS
jgi:hypothetical protein